MGIYVQRSRRADFWAKVVGIVVLLLLGAVVGALLAVTLAERMLVKADALHIDPFESVLLVVSNYDRQNTGIRYEDELDGTLYLQPTDYVQVTKHYWFLEPTEAMSGTVSAHDLEATY